MRGLDVNINIAYETGRSVGGPVGLETVDIAGWRTQSDNAYAESTACSGMGLALTSSGWGILYRRVCLRGANFVDWDDVNVLGKAPLLLSIKSG